MIARCHQQGGFELVLMVTAAVTAVFLARRGRRGA